jgi:hypothetical protein
MMKPAGMARMNPVTEKMDISHAALAMSRWKTALRMGITGGTLN